MQARVQLLAWLALLPIALAANLRLTAGEAIGRRTLHSLPNGACPVGVEVVTLRQRPFSGIGDQTSGGGHLVLKPSVFATPAEITWATDLLSEGSWGEGDDGGLSWQLCFYAEGAQSLTFIFRELHLPPESGLLVCSPAAEACAPRACAPPGCQHLTIHSLPMSGVTITAPVPGASALLRYSQPPSFGQPQLPFAVELQAVQLGLRPLPPFISLGQQGQQQAWHQRGQADPSQQAKQGQQGQQEQQQQQPDVLQQQAQQQVATLAASKLPTSKPPKPSEVVDAMHAILQRRANTSLSCEISVACEAGWAQEANAVVQILAFDDDGGNFCTGTLINSPEHVQYILTANHCLGLDDSTHTSMYWGVLFNYEPPCGASTYNATYQLLLGVEIVWANEISDVVLLRLDDAIPPEYTPYFLGWNASAGAEPTNGSVCIHHARGDFKMISFSDLPVQMGSYLVAERTHYIVSWSRGTTEDGSSGALLIDSTSKMGLGVLTGSTSAQPQCKGGSDYFGALYEAWDMGLWEYLGSGSPDGPSSMGPRQPINDGPGLIVNPDRLVVTEGSRRPARLQVWLSEAPAAGETLEVAISVLPGPVVNASSDLLTFSGADWNVPQTLSILPGEDDLPTGILVFQVVLQLSSRQNAPFRKRRVIPGVRIDDDVAAGRSPDHPVVVGSLTWASKGRLGPGREPYPQIRLDNATLSEFVGQVKPGSAAYYSLAPTSRTDLTLGACSRKLELRVAVFVAQQAEWVSSESCAATNPGACQAVEDRGLGCSGFEGIQLPATNASSPHVIAIYSLSSTPGPYGFEVRPLKADGSAVPIGNLTVVPPAAAQTDVNVPLPS